MSTVEPCVGKDADITSRHSSIGCHARRLIPVMATGVGSHGICTTESPSLLVLGLHIHSLCVVKVGCVFCRKGECTDTWGGGHAGIILNQALYQSTCTHSVNHYNNTKKYILLFTTFYKWVDWGTEKHQ